MTPLFTKHFREASPSASFGKEATLSKLTFERDIGIDSLRGGSLLQCMSLDHVTSDVWGMSNFCDAKAFVVMRGNAETHAHYWRVIAAHGRDRYIANQPIVAMYAEGEPD